MLEDLLYLISFFVESQLLFENTHEIDKQTV